jgi:hypothetical protein
MEYVKETMLHCYYNLEIGYLGLCFSLENRIRQTTFH